MAITDPDPEPATTARWSTDVELAEELNISRSGVHRLRRAGMPSLVVGRCRRYDPDECIAWLRDQATADHGEAERPHPDPEPHRSGVRRVARTGRDAA